MQYSFLQRLFMILFLARSLNMMSVSKRMPKEIWAFEYQKWQKWTHITEFMIKRCMDVHVKSVISAQKETWKRSEHLSFEFVPFHFTTNRDLCHGWQLQNHKLTFSFIIKVCQAITLDEFNFITVQVALL